MHEMKGLVGDRGDGFVLAHETDVSFLLNRAKCVAVILLIGIQLIKKILEKCITLSKPEDQFQKQLQVRHYSHVLPLPILPRTEPSSTSTVFQLAQT